MTEWKWVGVFLVLAAAVFIHASVSRYSIVVEEISGAPLIYRLDSFTGNVEMEIVARKFHPYPSWLTAPDGSAFQPTVSTTPESPDLTIAEKIRRLNESDPDVLRRLRQSLEEAASPDPK